MPSAITNVDFFCSPLNPNGLFTMSFADVTARESYFAGQKISGISITTGTYARKDGVLTVGVNETILNANGVNYVRFNNSQFNGKWFYAFVRKIEYVNPQTSKLYIDTDVFMTYQFDIDTSFAYMERQIVSPTEDNLINNILPEPVKCNGYMKKSLWNRIYDISTEAAFDSAFDIAVIASTMNVTGDGTTNDKAKAILNTGAHYLDGSPLGGSLICTKTMNDFKLLIECLTILNAEIVAVFPIDPARLDGATPTNVDYETKIVSGSSVVDHTYSFNIYTTGFLPEAWETVSLPSGTSTPDGAAVSPWTHNVRNKKLFTYPYLYLVGDNHSGSEAIFRYDLFSNHEAKFDYHYLCSPASALVLRAKGYEGVNNIENSVINSNVPQIPYEINVYSRYNAQNYNSLVFGAKMTAVNWGLNLGNDLINLGGSYSTSENKYGVATTETIGNPMGMFQDTMDAIGSIGRTQASLKDMQGLGNSVHNMPSGNLLGYAGELGVSIYQKYVCEDDAKRIDSFFDRYGYAVEEVRPIQWGSGQTGRPDYNYMKTRGCNVVGRIPADDKAKLNGLFDKGITIWNNTNRYGLYADNNNPNR